MKSATWLLTMVLLVWCMLLQCRADNLITEPGNGPLAQSAPHSTLGFDFTIGAESLFVSSLGIYDYAQDGLLESHAIGLWTTTGTLLASVVVPMGTAAPLSQQFRYEGLTTPVILNSGQTYVLGASYIGGINSDILLGNYPESAAFSDAVSPGHSRAGVGNGFTYPELVGGLGSNVGPNAQFTVAPEPNTFTLIFIGLLIIAAKAINYLRPKHKCFWHNAARQRFSPFKAQNLV